MIPVLLDRHETAKKLHISLWTLHRLTKHSENTEITDKTAFLEFDPAQNKFKVRSHAERQQEIEQARQAEQDDLKAKMEALRQKIGLTEDEMKDLLQISRKLQQN